MNYIANVLDIELDIEEAGYSKIYLNKSNRKYETNKIGNRT